MKITKKHLQTWHESWKKSARKTPFNSSISDALFNIGISAVELQTYIQCAMIKPEAKRTPLEQYAVHLHKVIQFECYHELLDFCATSPKTAIDVLRGSHQYETKHVVKVENVSLADVIADATEHKA